MISETERVPSTLPEGSSAPSKSSPVCEDKTTVPNRIIEEETVQQRIEEPTQQRIEETNNPAVENPPIHVDLAPDAPPTSAKEAPPPSANGNIHDERVVKGDEEIRSDDDDDKLVINECNEPSLVNESDNDSVQKTVSKRPVSLEDTDDLPSSKNVSKRPVSLEDTDDLPSSKNVSKRPVSLEDTDDLPSSKNVSKRPVSLEESDDLPSSKRIRIEEEKESLGHLESSISILKRDLEGIEFLLKQKEEEWNALLRLQKKKEESYLRLVRKRRTILIREQNLEQVQNREQEENDKTSEVIFLPEGLYSSIGGSQIPSMMMRHFLGNIPVPQIVSLPNSEVKSFQNTNGPISHSNVSVIDIHTSSKKTYGSSRDALPKISITPEAHSKLGKQLNLSSVKPILPKPFNAGEDGGPPGALGPTGYGPHGPTVSVQHLIATHRKDNPNVPPIRGAKRGSWRYRYDASNKRSSSREPDRPSSVSSSSSETELRGAAHSSSASSTDIRGGAHSSSTQSKGTGSSSANNSMLPINDPSVSYKDVLLQFAQLTQTEKSPGSPQISIIPVSSGDTSTRKSEPIPDSTSVSRELPVSSQHSNQGGQLEGSSALAKLLLETGQGGTGSKTSSVDLTSCNSSSPQYLTLSALLSGGTTTTVKEKAAPLSQNEIRPKKGSEESNSNPKCQGCHKNRAQFVCAGCGNQWYCSRECQVTAWEEHSERCNN